MLLSFCATIRDITIFQRGRGYLAARDGAQAKEQEPRVEEEQHEEQGEGRGAVQDILGGRKGSGEG